MVFASIKKLANELTESLIFFKDMHGAWSFSIYITFALIIWLQNEIDFLRAVEVVHCFYMLLVMFMIFVALPLQVRRSYETETH